ncbi:MAG: ATP-binding protein, partial [Candidatus Thorarchaeota archaeon]
QGFIRDYEVKKKRKDGTSYLALLNVNIIDIEGEPLLHTTVRDITYQKLAENKLKETEQKFRSFVESTPVATFLYQDYECIYVNPATKDLTEYSLDELYSMKFWDFVHPDYRNIVINIGKALERNELFKLVNEIKIITKSGIEKWINGNMVLIEYEGKRAALISAIDITERKKAREELNKLSRLKSELLTRTSHELKTPAMHIKGYTDLLLHKYKDNLNKEELNIIRLIKKGVLRLETLIYDILHKAELDSGGSELNRIEHNLSSLIELCVRELNSYAALRGHSIILNIHDNIKINFDRDHIRHVINNLITNAIKYTPLNGIIEISSEVDDDFVTIAVHDNGIGIIENEKERLFSQFGKIEHFGQGFDIITEGSGLGLYIAKKVIDLHGGKIWVESEGRNKGSTFYFSLPITTI